MADPAASNRRSGQTELGAILRRLSLVFVVVALFSGVINVLALTGSFYMLQVYDRVLPSRSLPTLVGLTILMFGLFAANGLLDFIRVRLMTRVGLRIDRQMRQKVFNAVQLLPLRARQGGDALQPVRDLDTIRAFMSSMGPTALFDLPWMPLYLGVVFVLHPLLGLFALVGALVLVCLTLLTEIRSAGPVREAAKSASARMVAAEANRRNAEVIRAMGMGERLADRWQQINNRHLTDQLAASDAANGIGTVTKIIRMFLQSGILGLGAYLVIEDKVTAGTIIASSITMSRSLAPIETAIAHWRSFVAARHSYRRLNDLLGVLASQTEEKVLELPKPKQALAVQALAVAPPGEQRPIIHNVSFMVPAGSGLGVIGPSASGKSTLARALVGAWLPLRQGGGVRLDGATLDQWSPTSLGRHIGYLPQDIELFDGTIAENIARFDPEAPGESIIRAAKEAGVHDMIVSLPQGYDTRIGEGGQSISAGQRQRVALARALYGDPFLVVLDEPNSNLDAQGEAALTQAIKTVRQRGGIVVIVAHRPSALAACDLVLAMANGQVQAFGPKDEVLRKILQPTPPPAGGPAPGAPAAAAARPAGGPAPGGLPLAALGPGLKIVTDRQGGA